MDETTNYISVLLKPLVVGFTLHNLARSHTSIWGVGLRHTQIHHVHILTNNTEYTFWFFGACIDSWWKKSCTTQGVRKGGFISAMINFHTPLSGAGVFHQPYHSHITPGSFPSILFRLIEVFNFMEKYGMPDRPKTSECLVIGVRWWIVLRFIDSFRNDFNVNPSLLVYSSIVQKEILDKMPRWRCSKIVIYPTYIIVI